LLSSLSDSLPSVVPPPLCAFKRFGITPKEREVFAGIVLGCTAAEIAARLCVEPCTVAYHKKNLARKTGTTNQVQMVARMYFLVRD
jgi:DNA-binding CsgD family transcriptional regulator